MQKSLNRKTKHMTQFNPDAITQIASDQATILEKISSIDKRVESIENKLSRDTVTKETFADMKVEANDREQRIRALESKMWTATGASGILGAVVTYLITYFIKGL